MASAREVPNRRDRAISSNSLERGPRGSARTTSCIEAEDPIPASSIRDNRKEAIGNVERIDSICFRADSRNDNRNAVPPRNAPRKIARKAFIGEGFQLSIRAPVAKKINSPANHPFREGTR
jgi:hypothetical protein